MAVVVVIVIVIVVVFLRFSYRLVDSMTAILREISVTCFFSSYLVVLALELLRLTGRIPGRAIAVIVMTVIGIFTHAVFLSLGGGGGDGLLASWSEWSLLIALGLAACFLASYVRRPETVVSFFFVPVILALIALSWMVRSMAPFSRTDAVEIWRTVHIFSMMMGVAVVLLGFLSGLMGAVQSWRLKSHRAGSALKLPTLETLLRWNGRALIGGTIAVGIGLLAGVVMNFNRWGFVGWTSRGVLFSVALFAWLLVATLIDRFYPPFGRGRNGVYLTLVSAGFLVLAMLGILSTPHGNNNGVINHGVIAPLSQNEVGVNVPRREPAER